MLGRLHSVGAAIRDPQHGAPCPWPAWTLAPSPNSPRGGGGSWATGTQAGLEPRGWWCPQGHGERQAGGQTWFCPLGALVKGL